MTQLKVGKKVSCLVSMRGLCTMFVCSLCLLMTACGASPPGVPPPGGEQDIANQLDAMADETAVAEGETGLEDEDGPANAAPQRTPRARATARGQDGATGGQGRTVRQLMEAGNAALEAGNLQQAVRLFTQVIQREPKRAEAYIGRGKAYRQQRKLDEALADLDQAIALNAEAFFAYVERGTIYARQGKNEQALADFGRAIEINPQRVAPYMQRGTFYLEQGDTAQAIADFDQVIELNPKATWAYLRRGMAYAAQNNLDDAIDNFDQAIELAPRLAPAYLQRGRVHAQAGNEEQAEGDFRQVLDITDNPRLREQAEQGLRGELELTGTPTVTTTTTPTPARTSQQLPDSLRDYLALHALHQENATMSIAMVH